jgi:hypothetical protein
MSPERSRRESNPPTGDRQSPNVTRRTRKQMAGEAGFEPTTSTVQSGVFYQLNYSPMPESGPGESNPGSLVWKTRVRDHRTATRKQKARAGTGARDRTWTVGVKARRPAIRRTPARESDDDAMKGRRREGAEETERKPRSRGPARCSPDAGPRPPHAAPDPSSPSISPVQYT